MIKFVLDLFLLYADGIHIRKGLRDLAKILIVDDDSHIRELVGLLLRDEGFQVYEASDGVEALKTLESIQVDMVILDIMMPNMDGNYARS